MGAVSVVLRRSASLLRSRPRCQSSRFSADVRWHSKLRKSGPQVNGLVRRRYFYRRLLRPASGGAALPDRSKPLPAPQSTRRLWRNAANARATLDEGQIRDEPLQAARRNGGHLQAGIYGRRGVGPAGSAQRSPRIAPNSMTASDQFGASPAFPRRSVRANLADRSRRWALLLPPTAGGPLAVIQRLDPMYVDIQQSSADLIEAQAGRRRGCGVSPRAVRRFASSSRMELIMVTPELSSFPK